MSGIRFLGQIKAALATKALFVAVTGLQSHRLFVDCVSSGPLYIDGFFAFGDMRFVFHQTGCAFLRLIWPLVTHMTQPCQRMRGRSDKSRQLHVKESLSDVRSKRSLAASKESDLGPSQTRRAAHVRCWDA